MAGMAGLGLGVVIGILSLWTGCTTDRLSAILDLTHDFDEQTIYWPTNKPFQSERTAWGPTPQGYWYASANFAASEHGGTHIDAPIHFAEGGQTVGRIPIDRLVGPGIVLDVRAQCHEQPDYEIQTADITAWEARHDRMPQGAIVLVLTGWGQRWPDRKRYLGSETPDNASTLHFPGFSAEAAKLLVQRAVRGVGIDTASIDPGRSTDFPAHRIFNGAGVYALENVASLERLPAQGSTIIALPVKIREGTGAPVRIIALVHPGL
jgi:kynurenine formamidase